MQQKKGDRAAFAAHAVGFAFEVNSSQVYVALQTGGTEDSCWPVDSLLFSLPTVCWPKEGQALAADGMQLILIRGSKFTVKPHPTLRIGFYEIYIKNTPNVSVLRQWELKISHLFSEFQKGLVHTSRLLSCPSGPTPFGLGIHLWCVSSLGQGSVFVLVTRWS